MKIYYSIGNKLLLTDDHADHYETDDKGQFTKLVFDNVTNVKVL